MTASSSRLAARVLVAANPRIACRGWSCGRHCCLRDKSDTFAIPSSREVRQGHRNFSQNARKESAWPAGKDAQDGAASAGTSSRTSQATASGRRRTVPPGERAVTVRDIDELKANGEKIAVVTAYDYPSALSIRSAAVDICLVGDSLANVALGHRTTHPLPLSAMIAHVQAVARGLRHQALNQVDMPRVPLLIVDLPYGYAEVSVEEGVKAAIALVKEGGADGVKIEGEEEIIPLVERLTSFGIPVMAHIGLQPQRASSGSALNLAGRTAMEAASMLYTAQALEESGAFACVLECIPARVGEAISSRIGMATIGIGAGKGTHGQVLVGDDILGELSSPLHVLAGMDSTSIAPSASSQATNPGSSSPTSSTSPAIPIDWPASPRFVRNFTANITGGSSFGMLRMAAIQAYVRAVKDGSFPDEAESYKMKREEWASFKEILDSIDKGEPEEEGFVLQSDGAPSNVKP